MAEEKLPSAVDIIVMGTGLPESMVSASLSRIGKKVLHIDRNDYYGGLWATFNFDPILKWCADDRSVERTNSYSGGIPIPQFDNFVRNKVIKSYIKEKNEIEVTPTVRNDESIENPPSIASTSISKETQPEERELKEAIEVKSSEEPQGETKADCDAIAVEPDQSHQDSGGNVANSTNTDGMKNDDTSILKKTAKKPQPSIVSQAKVNNKSPDISVEDLKILSRKFNLDTAPKFLYSAGPLVQSILKANISHYAEFKAVDRILTCKDETVIEVPCNRSDVFTSTFLTMIEKRTLMKFLTFCIELDFESPTDELNEIANKPFKEFLQSRRLSENLQNFVIYSIAMVKPHILTISGLKETCRFLRSLNRYGKSPFIWPLFGVGELPQAFCRMSAVFGCLYCLHKPASSIEISQSVEEESCIKVTLDDEIIECKHLIMNRSYVPSKYISVDQKPPEVSMAILITNASILPSESEHVSFLTIPPLPGKEELVKIVELGPSSSACPSGLFVLYLTAVATETAYTDLEEYAKLLTVQDNSDNSSNKPRLLWSLYFNEIMNNDDIRDLPENMFATCMPGSSLGFADAVADAERIFKEICPSEEFMMTVPNSEDIIWESDEQSADPIADQSEDPQYTAESTTTTIIGATTTASTTASVEVANIKQISSNEEKVPTDNSSSTNVLDSENENEES